MKTDGKKRVIATVIALLNVAAMLKANTLPLRAQRLADGKYVDSVELARMYDLGSNVSATADRVEYKATGGEFSAQAEHREIRINGVRHWLTFPAVAKAGRLWIPEIDVLKTIDPILHSDRLHASRPIRVIVLDPGHGGGDPGTRGRTAHTEKEFTLDMAKRVEQHLANNGAQVVLTRTSDHFVSLEDRVQFTKTRHGDVFVSLHFNSGGDASGIETYCEPPTTPAPRIGPRGFPVIPERRIPNPPDAENVWLAHCVQQAAVRATGAEDRGVRRARFYVLRFASCPSILVEGGFLTNRSEEQKILTPEYRERLAQAIASGILAYKTSMERRPSVTGALKGT